MMIDSKSNVLLNHDFAMGMHSWHPNCCDGFIVSGHPERNSGATGSYAVVTNRKQDWQGLEQDITNRVSSGSSYTVSAFVGVSEGSAHVMATVKLEYRNLATSYLFVGRTSVSKGKWGMLDGTFSLSSMPERVVFYFHGPSPGVDLLIDSAFIIFSSGTESEEGKKKMTYSTSSIILNHDFSQGLHSWHPNCCDGFVVSSESGYREWRSAESGGSYAVITNRKEDWQGLEQDITERVSQGSTYRVSACVGVLQGTSHVEATLRLEYRDSVTSYLFIGKTFVSKGKWGILEGTFSLSSMPERVVFYFHGPSPGVDLLVDSAVITLSSPSKSEKVKKNLIDSKSSIILNHDFSQGLHSWHPNCCEGFVGSSESGYPEGISTNSSKSYAVVTNRTECWQGLEQDITSRVSSGSTYTVCASIGVSGPLNGFADVQATLKLENQYSSTSYILVGRTFVSKEKREMLEGTFSLSSMPEQVVFYIHGPPSGVDLLIDSAVITLYSPNDSKV